ncbi:MAG: hypothetical protein LVR00_07130 [Rhabdochlamydiaceae bacterium]|jgi:hypothetical protein
MALPPISGSNRPEFVNPYHDIRDVAAHLAGTLLQLTKKITDATGSANSETLQKIAQFVRIIEQANTEVNSSVGDPREVALVKGYIKDTYTVLSTPDASIMGAVKEDTAEGPSVTTHLQRAIATFGTFPFALQNLVEELNGIAHDIQVVQPRHIG